MAQKPKRNSSQSYLLFSLFILFLFSGFVLVETTLGAEGVIYKGPRPMKKTLEEEESGKAGSEKEKKYSYDPLGKTDPFESFIAKMEAIQEKKKGKPKTYLETLDLSQLELIAIIVGPKGNWAMVREAKGTGHVIKVGTPIGTRGGVVYKITDKEVIIKEEYRDFRGQTRERFVSKKLPSLK
ncbi:MAG: pilus assembly protein PilP [Deltaproteobacteria bacterium]|nr:pilus assembly protein PilP [Deltaproteobacteria bacterium]